MLRMRNYSATSGRLRSFHKTGHVNEFRHTANFRCRTGAPAVDAFRRIDDGVGVDAVVAIEVVDGAGLAEMLDAERFQAMAAHAAEPGQRRRVSVDHGHEAAIARQRREQLFDMGQMRHAAAIAAQASCRAPTRMQPIS